MTFFDEQRHNKKRYFDVSDLRWELGDDEEEFRNMEIKRISKGAKLW